MSLVAPCTAQTNRAHRDIPQYFNRHLRRREAGGWHWFCFLLAANEENLSTNPETGKAPVAAKHQGQARWLDTHVVTSLRRAYLAFLGLVRSISKLMSLTLKAGDQSSADHSSPEVRDLRPGEGFWNQMMTIFLAGPTERGRV
jgi:hypothetical protein